MHKAKVCTIHCFLDIPGTATEKIPTQTPFTPAGQENIEKFSNPPVKTEENEDGKSDDRPVEESTEQPAPVEATPVNDKENVLVDHKTQNGSHSIGKCGCTQKYMVGRMY